MLFDKAGLLRNKVLLKYTNLSSAIIQSFSLLEPLWKYLRIFLLMP